MFVEVRQLWDKTGKRDNRELAAAGIRGIFKSYLLGNFTVANIVHTEDAVGSARQRLLLPTLYSPVLESMEGDSMILKGSQIIDGQLVEQHWSVKFLARIPPPRI